MRLLDLGQVSVLQSLLGMNRQNASGASESVVGTAKVHTSDTVLSQSRRAHNAGFNGHVKIGQLKSRLGKALEEFCDGQKLGVTGALPQEFSINQL